MPRPGRGDRCLLLVALAAIATLSLTVALASNGSGAALDLAPKQMLLRLHELPPGYLVADDSGCGQMTPDENVPPKLEAFILKYWPQACSFEYERLYRLAGHEPYPPRVESIAIAVPSEDAADEGFEIAPQLADYWSGSRLHEVAPPKPIGEATRWFHTERAFEGGSSREDSIAVWRFGPTLAVLAVSGRRQTANDRIASMLSLQQQTHVEHPTPYLPRQYDETLVPLDNPRLGVPVYWLGRTFRPAHGLRTARLEHASGPIRRGEGPPGERLELSYRNNLNLGVWPRAGWKRLQKTSLGRELAAAPCTTSTKLRLRRGRAIVYARYARGAAAGPPMPLPSPSHREPPPGDRQVHISKSRRCAGRRPNRFFAAAYVGRVVVAVNLPACIPCARESGYGPYNSLRAMKAVVRSLRFRPRRG